MKPRIPRQISAYLLRRLRNVIRGVRFRQVFRSRTDLLCAMNDNASDREPSPSKTVLLLRRIDQPAVAVVLCTCLLLIGLFVFRLWRTKQGVIDIDNRATQNAQLCVDLNLAPWPEFANLPGIGEFLGRTIVSYRQQHGEFQAIDDVKRVPGIGENRFKQIKPYLVISVPAGH